MKIALVLERFDPHRGGLEHWTWQFARRLLEGGHEVLVVAFEFHPSAEESGVILQRLQEMPRSRLARAEMLAEFLPTLRCDIVHDMGIGWQADVIHPHGGSTVALWEHNLRRIPKWRQIRFWREKRYRELAEVERCQHAESTAVIVAVSRMVQRHFEMLHGVPASRLRMIPNGVDVEQFSPTRRATLREPMRRELGLTTETCFLMLAHNLVLKNAEGLLRAAAELARSGAALRVVIGGGGKVEPFVRLARKLGIEAKVSFVGSVDPARYYAAADAFVHPTWYDPCSLVTLEASASALPVITTRYNGAAELMTEGKEGFLLDHPADVSALATRMQALLDPARREAMGAAGRAMALANTFELQTERFLELYAEIVAARGTP